jgi:arabinogalactan endo-1,4-beta-galactosidase
MYIYAISGGKTWQTETNVDGWRNFRTPELADIPVGDDGIVTVGTYIACDADGWGSLDDFVLSPQD